MLHYVKYTGEKELSSSFETLPSLTQPYVPNPFHPHQSAPMLPDFSYFPDQVRIPIISFVIM